MTPKLILSSEGTLKYVAEWPDEPVICDDYKETGICKYDICVNREEEYNKAIKQAIANAVPFKNKDEDIEIKRLIFDSIPPIEDVRSFSEWKMEPLKPYDIPEEIIIEFRYFDAAYSPSIEITEEQYNKLSWMKKKRAFIKHEPKEETLSEELDLILSHTELSPKEEVQSQAKNKLIKDITQKYYGARADAGDSSLSLIHDFEIWLINYMEQFRIERIK